MKSEWKVRHLKPVDFVPKRDTGITILYKDIGDGYYEYKYAICNPKDMYNRKIGIKTALSKEYVGKVYLYS